MTINKALEIATKAHEGQLDKSGVAYIHHPIGVAELVEGDDAKIVALLHDVIEDTALTMEDLRQADFSEEVLAAVQVITKVKGECNDAYIARVKENPLALRVKLADIEHNRGRMEGIADSATRERLKLKYERALQLMEVLA